MLVNVEKVKSWYLLVEEGVLFDFVLPNYEVELAMRSKI